MVFFGKRSIQSMAFFKFTAKCTKSFRGKEKKGRRRPNRSTKKGLCGRRVDGFGNNNELNCNFVIGIFKSWRDKSVMERMFHVDDDGNLLYKNFQIGTKNRTGIKLKFKFAYLMLFVNRVFADVPVAVMEEGENA